MSFDLIVYTRDEPSVETVREVVARYPGRVLRVLGETSLHVVPAVVSAGEARPVEIDFASVDGIGEVEQDVADELQLVAPDRWAAAQPIGWEMGIGCGSDASGEELELAYAVAVACVEQHAGIGWDPQRGCAIEADTMQTAAEGAVELARGSEQVGRLMGRAVGAHATSSEAHDAVRRLQRELDEAAALESGSRDRRGVARVVLRAVLVVAVVAVVVALVVVLRGQ